MPVNEPICTGVHASASAEQRAGACFDRARRLAARQSGPALLRIHCATPLFDPWQLLANRGMPGNAITAWHDGAADLSVLACDPLESAALAGPHPLAAARRACMRQGQAILDHPLAEGDTPLGASPWVMLGFAFDPRRRTAPRGPWATWPAGLFRIPSLIFVRQRASHGQLRAGVVVQVLVEAHSQRSLLNEALEQARQAKRMLRQTTPCEPGEPLRLDTPEPLEAEQDWQRRAAKVSEAAQAGELEKVVLAHGVRWRPPKGHGFDAIGTLFELRRSHPTAVTVGIQGPDGSVFVAATPETLVRRHGSRVSTHALAGTAARGRTTDEDQLLGEQLQQRAKDQSEHRIVREAIVQALRPLCSTLSFPQRPRLRRLAAVQHLETPIEGELHPGTHLLELVDRLHPTPAVNGSPRDSARDWLRGQEALDRGWYAGPLGYLTPAGDGSFVVSIRCALIRAQHATAFVGAGIVADSQPRAEWAETQLKLSTIARALRVSEQKP